MMSYTNCRLCPRRCGVDRNAGIRGFCGETAELRIASASIHRGEEPPITGNGGSGTIFVTGCTLGCTFCQNYQISHNALGRVVSSEEFVDMCLALQNRGAENINIVTGSHAIPAIVSGLLAARARDLCIPILWNSSAYESLEGLSLLEDLADVYLPDLKTLDPVLSRRFFKVPDYPDHAAAAILRMMDVRGNPRYMAATISGEDRPKADAPPALKSGVVIRHLALPGYLESTRQVLRWFAEHGQGRALLSLMTQYTPIQRRTDQSQADSNPGHSDPQRYLNKEEYETILGWIEEFGVEEGFYQELVTGSEWLPDFSQTNPFSSELSIPVWHWREGK